MLEIATLPGAEAGNTAVAAALSELINHVYEAAEDGLWVAGASRTDIEEIADLVRAGQIIVAMASGKIVGCVQIRLLGGGVGEFGMLAVDERHRGTGVGRALVRFAELAAQDRRCVTMQLEVLVPRGWSHPSKDFLIDWYTRLGYCRVRVDAMEDSHPELAPFLAVPCDLVIYHKPLAPEQARQ